MPKIFVHSYNADEIAEGVSVSEHRLSSNTVNSAENKMEEINKQYESSNTVLVMAGDREVDQALAELFAECFNGKIFTIKSLLYPDFYFGSYMISDLKINIKNNPRVDLFVVIIPHRNYSFILRELKETCRRDMVDAEVI